MVSVARDEGINGSDIAACSDHHAFAKLFPTSEAREARACFDAMQRYFFSASQPRVSSSESLPACLAVSLFGTVSQLLWSVVHVIGGFSLCDCLRLSVYFVYLAAPCTHLRLQVSF